ncbi:MAG: SPOR domain-containing protein [Sedimenticola sp.]
MSISLRKPRAWFLLLLLLAMRPVSAADEDVMAGYEAYKAGEYEKAVELWQEPARVGNARAQFFLSVVYAEGIVVPRDPLRALYLLKDAARGGLRTAQFDLGMRFQQGRGVEKDERAGAYWLSRAAHSDLAKAQYNLGAVFYIGKGIESNREQALYWYRRAAANGSEQAHSALQRLGEPLELEQVQADENSSQQVLAATRPGTEKESARPSQAYLHIDSENNIKNKRLNIISKVRHEDSVADQSKDTVAVTGDKAWILAQPADHYTVQIASSDRRDQADALIAGLSLADRLAIFPYSLAGKERFGVIHGSYNSEDEAFGALTVLPEKLLKAGPWPRRFGTIWRLMEDSVAKKQNAALQ